MTVYECDKCNKQFYKKDNVQTVFFFKIVERASEAMKNKIERKLDICLLCIEKAFGDIKPNKGECDE